MRVLDGIDDSEIQRLRAAGEFFWLDLMAPTAEQLHDVAAQFDLHPIVVEDLDHFEQPCTGSRSPR